MITLTTERIDSILQHFDTLPTDRQREVIARLALDKEDLREALVSATGLIRPTIPAGSYFLKEFDELIRRTKGVS